MSKIKRKIPQEAIHQFLQLVQEYPELAEMIVREPTGSIRIDHPEAPAEYEIEITAMRIKLISKNQPSNSIFSDTVVLGPQSYIAASIYEDQPSTVWLHVVRHGAKISVGLRPKKLRQLIKMLMYIYQLLDELKINPKTKKS